MPVTGGIESLHQANALAEYLAVPGFNETPFYGSNTTAF